MCPEYGIYHTRYPQDDKGFNSKETAQYISMTDIKVSDLLFTQKLNSTQINSLMKIYSIYSLRIAYLHHYHLPVFVINVDANLISMQIQVALVHMLESGMRHLMIVHI
jgi:hypothetical protein